MLKNPQFQTCTCFTEIQTLEAPAAALVDVLNEIIILQTLLLTELLNEIVVTITTQQVTSAT
jgi:hypothetical protein